MDYQAAIEYLYQLGPETLAMKLGLDNTLQLLAQLGNPQTAYPIVHVAGTNGKGSFCAMLTQICHQAGLRTGLFTSPHLCQITERYRYQLQAITPAEFAHYTQRVQQAITSIRANQTPALTTTSLMPTSATIATLDNYAPPRNRVEMAQFAPTFFEQITAIGLLYFQTVSPDIVILEVGLGGRLDSTNVVHPCLSVITKIAFDHERQLGNTLTVIAKEKAGIIKPGVPTIVAPQADAVMEVFRQVAQTQNAAITFLDPHLTSHYLADGYWQLDWVSPQGERYVTRLGLRGQHQVATAALAILAAEELQRQGFKISKPAILAGLAHTRWPGRLEVLPVQPTVLVDGAHNPDGIHTLVEFLPAWFAERQFTRRILLFGAMHDKKIDTMAAALFPLFDQVILVARDAPRAAQFHTELASWTTVDGNGPQVQRQEGTLAAWRRAQQLCPADGVLVVAGSLHLVGEVLELCQRSAADLEANVALESMLAPH
jgi:dihydrofolate synthase / folylpolyglutamate synthase